MPRKHGATRARAENRKQVRARARRLKALANRRRRK